MTIASLVPIFLLRPFLTQRRSRADGVMPVLSPAPDLHYLNAMLDLTKIFYFIFGLLTLAGGLMAFCIAAACLAHRGRHFRDLLLVAGWLIGAGKQCRV